MLKYDPDYFEAKNLCKYVVKKLLFLMANLSHCCKTHKMCYKVFLENVFINERINE